MTMRMVMMFDVADKWLLMRLGTFEEHSTWGNPLNSRLCCFGFCLIWNSFRLSLKTWKSILLNETFFSQAKDFIKKKISYHIFQFKCILIIIIPGTDPKMPFLGGNNSKKPDKPGTSSGGTFDCEYTFYLQWRCKDGFYHSAQHNQKL